MFHFINGLLLVNLVYIYGVKSPVLSYLLSAEAIRGLELAWDRGVVMVRQFNFLFACLYLHGYKYLIPYPCARKYLYNHTHIKTLILHLISKKLLEKTDEAFPRSPILRMG